MNSTSVKIEGIDRSDMGTTHGVQSRHRQRRILLAWSTSLLSKAATIAVQILAVPLVYRALGQGGYAAYAAVTASAGLISALNLGIGGSLVTPIAEASAKSDPRQEALLVQAGLGPLVLMCIVGSLVAIPIASFAPLQMLFGQIGRLGIPNLRVGALIAVVATLAAVPVSAVTFLRQAYQEMHVSNIIGGAANCILCAALVIAARRSTAVSVFVAIFLLFPLTAQAVNLGALLVRRPYLFHSAGRRVVRYSRQLMADGLRFIGADFSYVMVYQWPIYWVARSMPSSNSSLFAICMQAVLLPLASVFGLLQPLWPSIADAVAQGDRVWLDSSLKRGRRWVLATGATAVVIMLWCGGILIHLWLRRPVTIGWWTRLFMGMYMALAIWEYYHFMVILGLGMLRKAASAIFYRALSFAIAVPILAHVGGAPLIWCGMCCSILFWTAWRLPSVMHSHALHGARIEV